MAKNGNAHPYLTDIGKEAAKKGKTEPTKKKLKLNTAPLGVKAVKKRKRLRVKRGGNYKERMTTIVGVER